MINWNVADDYYRCLKLEVEEQSRKSANEATELSTQLGKERSCNEEQYHLIKHLRAKIKSLEASLAGSKDSSSNPPPDAQIPSVCEWHPKDGSNPTDFAAQRACSVEGCNKFGQFQFCGIWVCYNHHRTIEVNWRREEHG